MKRILLLSLLLLPIFVIAQYPTFSNKQRLGVQTTGDGLIFRGTTINNIPNYTPSNVNNAYFHLDTVHNKLYLYNTNAWQLVYPTTQFDTTTLNVYLKISDTTAMLLPYFRDSDTTSLNLINRFALKLNISDTVTMLNPYMKKADTISLSNRINLKLNISDTIILSNRITTNANNIITINNKLATKLDTIFTKFKNVVTMIENKDTINIGSSLTDGYAINIIGDSVNVDTTIIFTQSDTITLSNRIDTKLNVSDTVSLSNRIDLKLNKTDTINLSNRIDLKLNKSDTISLSNRIDIKLNASDTVSLSNRINTKLDTIYVNYPNYIDTITNKDTIQIAPSLVLTEGFGINIIADSINIDSAVILATQQKQIAYVKNQSGVTMYKGQAVYSSGSTGDNKLVQLASSNTEQASSKTFGIVETDSIPNGGHGYIITFGVLSGFNTNALTEDSSIYLSSTPGQLTSVKPIAPLHMVTIGICIRQQQNTGSIFVKIQNGFEFDELHDVRLTNLVDKASIYYNLSEDLWRDTTAALLVSDTASMLSKYVNTYSNQTGINGNKTFNNVVTIDSATVTGKLLVNTNISDAVKINSNTNSTNLELMNSGGSVFIKSGNKNMTLQTDTTALVYLKGDVNRVGILTMNPQQALEVAGTIRVDSLINSLTPNKLVGANNSNDLTDVKLGTGLSFLNDTLKISDNIINSGDTATLLRKDYVVGSNGIVIWTEGNKKLIPYFTQVYRNGQLLKSTQYIITSDSIVTLNSDSYKIANIITIIAIDNIVALAGSGGVISLQGDVSGSGTNSITTTIGTSKVLNSMLSGGISNDKLDVITTAGKVSNSATTATNVNTINTIVSRDGSGNFSAGIITASLNGNAVTSTTATIANGVQSYLSTGIIKLATSANAVQPVITVPNVNATMATTNLSQTFSGTQTFSSTISGSINGNASTATNVAYSGLTGTVPTWNQNTTGTAATITGIYGGTITSSQVTSGLGFTPYNATNPNSYITSSSLNSYAPLSNANFITAITTPNNTGSRISFYYANVASFPSASDSHGAVAHSHATGKMYYAHSGQWIEMANIASPTFTGTVSGITSTMVGLGNVDNTTDLNKPVSTATQTALNGKQNTISGTGFIKANGTSITFDNSTYLTTGTAASTYLPLTGGTLTGALNGTTGTFNTRLGVGGFVGTPTLFTSGNGDQEIHFTHTDNFPGRKVSLRLTNNNSGFFTFGGLIYALQGEGLNQYNRMTFGVNTSEIMHLTRFSRVGIMNISPSYTLDVNGTLGVTGATTLGSTLSVTGETTLNNDLILRTEGGRTTTAIRHLYSQQSRYAGEIQFQPSGASGSQLAFYTNVSGNNTQVERMKITENGFIYLNNFTNISGSLNVTGDGYIGSTLTVGGVTQLNSLANNGTKLVTASNTGLLSTATTVNETGLMTRGIFNITTGASVATFDVTHNLGVEPVSVIITPQTINGGATKIFYEVIGKTNTLFRVQAFNLTTGSPATNTLVSIFWMAIK